MNLFKKFKRYHKNFFHHTCNRLKSEKKIVQHFKRDLKCRNDYANLFDYFQISRNGKSTCEGTRYPRYDFISKNGCDMDAIEGVSRYLPYLAVNLLNMSELDERYSIYLHDFLKIISTGTNNKSKYYWGNPEDFDQLICEMADIALSVWILRERVWHLFNVHEQNNLFEWLSLGLCKKVVDNNWLLFKFLIQVILKDLGFDVSISNEIINKTKSWYVGDGWFKDGQHGEVDYYSCWGFVYSLFWISEIDKTIEPEFIKDVLLSASATYLFIVNQNGIPPLYGRSIPYRMAACCPVLASLVVSNDADSMDKASWILHKTYSHFSQNNSITNGSISSGFYEDNLVFVDNYSGPNSSLWSLRPIILAEYLYNKKLDVFNRPGCEMKLANPNVHHFCNNNLIIAIDEENVVRVSNKTLRKKGYRNDSLTSIKVFIKKILIFIFYQRIERTVIYRENFENSFSSENGFYKI